MDVSSPPPREEWTCRGFGKVKHWFYRAWFHEKTIAWDHTDVDYYKHTNSFFTDQHPYSSWSDYHYRVWPTRGWQLVLGATPSLPVWAACERWEQALYKEEQQLLAQQQRPPPDAHPRGVKRQAVDNLEHERVDLLIQSMIQRFTDMDVSGNPALHLTPEKQHQLIDGLVHNLSSYQDELHAVTDSSGNPLRLFSYLLT